MTGSRGPGSPAPSGEPDEPRHPDPRSDLDPSGEPTDAALLAAHVAGDPDAFGTLFRRHRDRLWAVALRTTGDREEAADALQDALVTAFRRADSFRGESAVTTWLHRVVVNACLDRLRRRRVRRADPLPGEPDGRDGTAPEVPTSAVVLDPADLVLDAELRARVLDALATLPLKQRAAVVLVDMEGYNVQETADILGVAKGTVKSRCSRARARLLPLLVDDCVGTRVDTGDTGAKGQEPAAGNPRAASRVPAEPEPGHPGEGDQPGPRQEPQGTRPRPLAAHEPLEGGAR